MINTDHLHFEPTDSDWACPDCGWIWDHKAAALRYSHPFAAPIIAGMVTAWLNQKYSFDSDSPINRDYPIDKEDSYSWAVEEMKSIEQGLTTKIRVVFPAE